MADQSDVENALVAAIELALYPNGVSADSAVGADDAMFRIYRGWPVSNALNTDLAVGVANVTVFPDGEPKDTTRYPTRWNVTTNTAPTLTLTKRGNIITFNGTTAAGQMVGIAANGMTFVYLVQAGDSNALVAAALSAQITAAGIFNQYSGVTLALPGATGVIARVEQAQTAFKETRRQRQRFRVSCWCPTPQLRDATASTVDAALAAQSFLTLADGTSARLTLAGGTTTDDQQNAGLYRRDFLYDAEYATILTAAQPAMVFGGGTLSTPAGELASLLG